MLDRRSFFAGGIAGLFGLSRPNPILLPTSDAMADYIRVRKTDRRLDLYRGYKVLCSLPLSLGKNPIGDKIYQGDNRTPEGLYRITSRNPRSAFYLSLGISYPNSLDRSEAAAAGRSPGGDIMIHGQRNGVKRLDTRDWTAGCIALSNPHMRLVWDRVAVGAPIRITP